MYEESGFKSIKGSGSTKLLIPLYTFMDNGSNTKAPYLLESVLLPNYTMLSPSIGASEFASQSVLDKSM